MVKVKANTIRCNTRQKKAQNKPSNPAYDTYQKWVKSKGFKELRNLALERDNYTCQFCGRTIEEIEGTKINLQAHHKTYENVGKGDEDELKDLIIVCNVCHKNIHSAKSNLRRFTDKSHILNNIKNNLKFECKIKNLYD